MTAPKFQAVHYRSGTWIVVLDETGEIVSPPVTRSTAEQIAAGMNNDAEPGAVSLTQLVLFLDSVDQEDAG